MNRQSVFNQVTRHLRQQGKRAVEMINGFEGGCRYRTEEGLRCAVGALLPEDHPGGGFRGTVHELLEKYPDLNESFGYPKDQDMTFLQQLQRLHDSVPVEDWEKALRHFATFWLLTYE